MAIASTALSTVDAKRFRSFERQRHDDLAKTYHEFFTPITALAIEPLFDQQDFKVASIFWMQQPGQALLPPKPVGQVLRPFGVDLSPGMIELAENSYPGIDFRVAEVEHLPFADRSFDAVVCNFGLGHFPYPEVSVAECIRTLRPAGRIALSWCDDPSKQRIQGLFREAIAEVGVAPPPDVPAGYSIFRFSDTNEFRHLLEGGGLAEIMVQDNNTTYLIRDVDTLWHGGMGSFAVTASTIAHQDKAVQVAIRAALERRASTCKTPAGLELLVAFKIGAGRNANQKPR